MIAQASGRLRIVVSGLAVTYPFGGVFWDYLNYVLGFLRLGHDVLYLEDTGKWVYDPAALSFVESGANNAATFAQHLKALDPALANRWFFRDCNEVGYGKTWEETYEFCRTADLFVHLSASTWMCDEYFTAPHVAFVDTDPMYTQARMFPDHEPTEEERDYMEWLASARLFTFGENIGQPGCEIPPGPFHWTPTRQPIVLDAFRDREVNWQERRGVLTTVASWEPAEEGPVLDGRQYFGKSVELLRFLGLPQRMPLPVEIAVSGKVPRKDLSAHGWIIRDPMEVSSDPWVYADYLARSRAELSVAKNAYVASRSGWFSCRSACYLALGVPVVVQDTGFTDRIPAGEGLFAFRTEDEAIGAVEAILSDPERQARAAREIAAEYFDSNRILSRFIEEACAAKAVSGEAA